MLLCGETHVADIHPPGRDTLIMDSDTMQARYSTVLQQVTEIASRFAAARSDRQLRRELASEDFHDLAEAGFLLTGVPAVSGGLWENARRSTRPIAEILRALSRGDASVALVASMHPAVLSLWLATEEAPAPFTDEWHAQRKEVTSLALNGHWWGTVTSEPDAGGDISRTKARAVAADNGQWAITGQKTFGSGSGITSFMITAAMADGEEEPDLFYLDVRDAQWDGSTGVRLLAPWDGHGMIATQSHAFALEGAPATRIAWPHNLETIAGNAGPFILSIFTAVVLGIVDEAVETARSRLQERADQLRPYEQVEWARAETEAWSAEQIYEGMLNAVERQQVPNRQAIMGKMAVAELAESVLRRLCRIMGGGTLARRSPFGFWFEDVRALGFLRPPWPLATDVLVATAWDPEEG